MKETKWTFKISLSWAIRFREAHFPPCCSAGGTQLGRALALLNSVHVLHTNFRSSASWRQKAGGIHPYASDAWHCARASEKMWNVCRGSERMSEQESLLVKPLRTLLLKTTRCFVNWTGLKRQRSLWPQGVHWRCLFGTHCVCFGENTEWKMHRMQTHGDKGPGLRRKSMGHVSKPMRLAKSSGIYDGF